MKKTNKLVMILILLSACTTEQVPKQTVNPSTTIAISSSIASPTISPKETARSKPQATPSITVTPNISKEIKKVEIYDKKTGRLLTSSENPKSKDPKEIADFDLVDNYYYDLEAKVTYTDNTTSSDFILKSSNEFIANVDITGRIFTHSTPDTGLFNLIILEKNTDKEIYISKVGAVFSESSMHIINTTGTIYDTENNILKDAKINISFLDLSLNEELKKIIIAQPILGVYKLGYIPVGNFIEIEATKEGYKSKKRTLLVSGDPATTKVINFGGSNPEDKQYALEKIN